MISHSVQSPRGLAGRWFGESLTLDANEKIVIPALRDFFERKFRFSIYPLPTDGWNYKRLVPEGILAEGETVQIFVLNRMWKKLLWHARRSASDLPWDLVAYALPKPIFAYLGMLVPSGVYLDDTTAAIIAKLSPQWRAGWFLHELTHLRNPDLSEEEVSQIAPMPALSLQDQLIVAREMMRIGRLHVGMRLFESLLLRPDLRSAENAKWVRKNLSENALIRMNCFSKIADKKCVDSEDYEALYNTVKTLGRHGGDPVIGVALQVLLRQWDQIGPVSVDVPWSVMGLRGRDEILAARLESLQAELDTPEGQAALELTLLTVLKLGDRERALMNTKPLHALADRLCAADPSSALWGPWVQSLLQALSRASDTVSQEKGLRMVQIIVQNLGQDNLHALTRGKAIVQWPIHWQAELIGPLSERLSVAEDRGALVRLCERSASSSSQSARQAATRAIAKFLNSPANSENPAEMESILLAGTVLVRNTGDHDLASQIMEGIVSRPLSEKSLPLWTRGGSVILRMGTENQARRFLRQAASAGVAAEAGLLADLLRNENLPAFTPPAMFFQSRLNTLLKNNPDLHLSGGRLDRLILAYDLPELVSRLINYYENPSSDKVSTLSTQNPHLRALAARATDEKLILFLDSLAKRATLEDHETMIDLLHASARGDLVRRYLAKRPWLAVLQPEAFQKRADRGSAASRRKARIVQSLSPLFGHNWLEANWGNIDSLLVRLVVLRRWWKRYPSDLLSMEHWKRLAENPQADPLFHLELYTLLAELENAAVSDRVEHSLVQEVMRSIDEGTQPVLSNRQQFTDLSQEMERWWEHKLWIEEKVPRRLESLFQHYARSLGLSVKGIVGMVAEVHGVASVRHGRALGAALSHGLSLRIVQKIMVTQSVEEVLEHHGWIKVDKTLLEKYHDRFVRAMAFLIPHEFGHVLLNKKSKRAEVKPPPLDIHLFPSFPGEYIELFAEEIVVDRVALEIAAKLGTYSAGFPEETPSLERAALGLAETIPLILAPERKEILQKQWNHHPGLLLAGLARFHGELLELANGMVPLSPQTQSLLAERAKMINGLVLTLVKTKPSFYKEYTELVKRFGRHYRLTTVTLNPRLTPAYVTPIVVVVVIPALVRHFFGEEPALVISRLLSFALAGLATYYFFKFFGPENTLLTRVKGYLERQRLSAA